MARPDKPRPPALTRRTGRDNESKNAEVKPSTHKPAIEGANWRENGPKRESKRNGDEDKDGANCNAPQWQTEKERIEIQTKRTEKNAVKWEDRKTNRRRGLIGQRRSGRAERSETKRESSEAPDVYETRGKTENGGDALAKANLPSLHSEFVVATATVFGL
jgi:hypothetical protein